MKLGKASIALTVVAALVLLAAIAVVWLNRGEQRGHPDQGGSDRRPRALHRGAALAGRAAAATPPQASGSGVEGAGGALACAGTGCEASHADTAPMSSMLRRCATCAMQSGGSARRWPLRQAPSWALR